MTEEFDFSEDEDITLPDPAMVAHLDQEQAAFDEMQEEFLDTFGFYHKCRCAEDYGAGRMVEVTECFSEMTGEALAACNRLTSENKLMNMMLQKMFAVANDNTIKEEESNVEREEND